MNCQTALLKTRELIENGWIQGSSAIDADGVPCNPHSPNAVCFCFDGALDRVTGNDYLLYGDTLDYIREATSIPSIIGFNDVTGRSKEDILSAIDTTIAFLGVVCCMNLQTFWDQLNEHDWFYAMSDDTEQYNKGKLNAQRLLHIAGDNVEAHGMFDAFIKHYFSKHYGFSGENVDKPVRPLGESV